LSFTLNLICALEPKFISRGSQFEKAFSSLFPDQGPDTHSRANAPPRLKTHNANPERSKIFSVISAATILNNGENLTPAVELRKWFRK